jgi:hypothetical protein
MTQTHVSQHAETPAATPEQIRSEPTTSEALSKDTLFEILKNRRRRDALAYLKANDGVATLSDMAEFIAAKENDIEIGALSSSQRKRVYIGLYQCHLPKMAAAGVVDFEKNRGDIELRPEAAQLDVYLADVEEDDDAASDSTVRNLAVAGGLGAAVVASLAGVPGFVLVPDAAWALLSTGALLALTALEARTADPDA